MEEQVSNLQAIIGKGKKVCSRLLEDAKGNIEEAIELFYENGDKYEEDVILINF